MLKRKIISDLKKAAKIIDQSEIKSGEKLLILNAIATVATIAGIENAFEKITEGI